MIDITLETVLGEARMNVYLLVVKEEVILLNSQIGLREHTVGEEMLQFLATVYHMLGIKDVREESVDACLEFGLGFG